jgi:glycosyltransferase involved in cell wall biosynthesis
MQSLLLATCRRLLSCDPPTPFPQLVRKASLTSHMESGPHDRIIFVPFLNTFGGVERLVVSLATYLHQHEIVGNIVCFEAKVNLQDYASIPVHVTELHPRRTPWHEASLLRDYLGSRETRYPVPLLFDLKSAFYAGLGLVVPYVLHLTDPPSLLPRDVSKHAPSVRRRYGTSASIPGPHRFAAARGEIVHRVNRRGVRRASSVIVMTEQIAHELHDLYGVEARIIHPGIRPAAESSQAPCPKGAKLHLLSTSRLEANKSIDRMLEALATLRESDPLFQDRIDWVLDVVGKGPAREYLEGLSHALGLQEQVKFHGHISDAELEQRYAKASVALVAGAQGYGLPALEALSRRVPVVVSVQSGVADLLKATPWAQITHDDTRALANAIAAMVRRVIDGAFNGLPLPAVPTESEWSSDVCRTCGWME